MKIFVFRLDQGKITTHGLGIGSRKRQTPVPAHGETIGDKERGLDHEGKTSRRCEIGFNNSDSGDRLLFCTV